MGTSPPPGLVVCAWRTTEVLMCLFYHYEYVCVCVCKHKDIKIPSSILLRLIHANKKYAAGGGREISPPYLLKSSFTNVS